MAAPWNDDIYQGETWTRDLWIAYLNEDGTEGDPVNITGYTAHMQVRTHSDALTPVADLSTANGKIVIDGPAGRISLILSATETAALPVVQLVYDLELIDGDGNVDKPVAGKLKVYREVTRG